MTDPTLAGFHWDVGTWIAFAAFLIAAATFYLTLLRPADIEIDQDARTTTFGAFGRSRAGIPEAFEAVVSIYASNLGAHGGLLASIDASGAVYRGSEPRLWSSMDRAEVRDSDTNLMVAFPITIQAGDFRSFRLRVVLRPMPGISADDPEAVARAVRGFEGALIQVAWSFVRTSGLPFAWKWLPLPIRRHRTIRWRSDMFEVDGRGYRGELIAMWRVKKDTAPLTEIAGDGDAGSRLELGRQ